MTLHAAVVMPDHVHLLLTPFETESGASVALGEILHSIKSFSANEVNKQERRTGPLWLDERWDRMVRTEKEFIETWEYIETNPDRAKLGDNYKWFWSSATGFEEAGVVRRKNGGEGSSGGLDRESAHRLEAGAARVESDHRLEAGATPASTAIQPVPDVLQPASNRCDTFFNTLSTIHIRTTCVAAADCTI